jgi:invasion protein IalB
VRPHKIIIAMALLSLFTRQAGAQSDAQSPPAQPAAQPQKLVANETQHVGDWMVRCFPGKSAAPCDMIYILAIKKTGDMLLSIRFAYVPAQNRNVIQIGVPLGVSFAKGIVISSDTGASAPLPFVHCDRGGCFVERVMDDASMDTLANAPGGAKVRFVSYAGREFAFPFPLNGFAKGRETMDQLARSHVQAK